jgi:shikimate dehydrogenase
VTAYCAVVGWPIEHSRSPAIMNAAFAAAGIDATMVALGVPPDRLAATVAELRARPMLGASVTVPHKATVLALCDDVAPAARAIGAVNCLALAGARLVGHNTDSDGFADAMAAAGVAIARAHCVVLGAGGAARAVVHALGTAATVDVIARRPTEVAWVRARPWTDAELRACFARADLVVDATPAGLDPEADATFGDALPLAALPAAARVATLVYHRRTRLLERASARGHSTLDGRAMLVHQGARAFRIWTGRDASVEVMTRALDASLA